MTQAQQAAVQLSNAVRDYRTALRKLRGRRKQEMQRALEGVVSSLCEELFAGHEQREILVTVSDQGKVAIYVKKPADVDRGAAT